MHNPESVKSSRPFSIAPVGHIRTHLPQCVHKPASVTGITGTGFFFCLRRILSAVYMNLSTDKTGLGGRFIRVTSIASGKPSAEDNFSDTARPRASAQAMSDPSGRPSAMGLDGVL